MSAAWGDDRRLVVWIAAALIFIATFAVFLPALNNGFVDWDDRDNFLLNNDFRGLSSANLRWMFTTFHMGHYQPLTWLTHGLNAEMAQRMYGDPVDPRPYHFTNNLLHAINAVLFFFIALRLMDAAQRRPSVSSNAQPPTKHRRSKTRADRPESPHAVVSVETIVAATLAALFFSLHPLRVESVAWITERRDLLSGFFILLTVIAYLRMVRMPSRSTAWLMIVTGLFLLSLISKVMGVTLPAVLLVLDWYPLRRLPGSPRQWFGPQHRGALLEKIPMLVLALGFSMIASIGQSRNHWLAPWWLHPLDARIVQSIYGLMFYGWKTIWPTHLLPIYEMVFPLNIHQWRFVVAAGLVVAAAAFVILIRRRFPSLSAVALCYTIMLTPVLGIMQNGTQLVADRYSYLPCLGWSILIGACVVKMATRRRLLTIPLLIVCVGGLGLLAYGTVRQIAVWHDTRTFWENLTRCDPGNSIGQNSVGFGLLQQGEVDQAIERFHKSLEIRPGYEQAHRNLISALIQKGDTEGLINACDSAINAGTQWDQPRLVATAHYRLGEIYRAQGRFEQAIEEYRAATRSNPDMLEAGTNLGFALGLSNRREQAIIEYQRVLSIDPNYFPALFNLGMSLSQAGRRDEAIEQLQRALRIQPDNESARTELERLRRGRQ